MPKYLTKEEAFLKCKKEGRFLVLEEIDVEKIKIENHQCLFVYLCEKHPDLEFSWEFFEKVRTKRNGINYYGLPVDNKDWKEVELQFTLYINALKKEIEKKINKK